MRLKKWTLAWKIRLIQEKPPCGSLWCPMDSRLRGNDGERFARMARTHDYVVSDLSLSFPRRRESIKAHPEQVFLRYFKLFLWLHFGLRICKAIRLILPKTCKFNTNNSTIFPYRSIYYYFIQGGLFISISASCLRRPLVSSLKVSQKGKNTSYQNSQGPSMRKS